MDRLFKTYIKPQFKEIYNPEILQEWKLNIDAAEFGKNVYFVYLILKK